MRSASLMPGSVIVQRNVEITNQPIDYVSAVRVVVWSYSLPPNEVHDLVFTLSGHASIR